ncbi:NeuD/PglB/VioB family sugar acetyltransferase [Cupriavidus sp. BIS7]|uniref:NeuD/PglB/VioB family sugar acetyltransferase n=1 Tax=Cupriavidus sp. BIS7 TaxID=1217718 RepID=UPI0004751D78|nr:NeuD/PglB/VioB family sugar acetyltransferase [Cupriavidus sp. BIS7]
MTHLLIVGAGGHGRAVAEAVLVAGTYTLAGFVDDGALELQQVWEYPVLGTTAELERCRQYAGAAIVAIGNNTVREQLQKQLTAFAFEVVTVIHPRAVVSPRAIIGPGCALMAAAVVGTEARLGAGVIVNSGAVVDHHCVIEDFGHLGTNASMAGGAVLERSAWMQAGAALGYGVKVEAGAVLAPGTALPRVER